MLKEKMKYFISLANKTQGDLAEELKCTRYVIQMRILQGTNIINMLEILNACDCDLYIKNRNTGEELILKVDDFPKKGK